MRRRDFIRSIERLAAGALCVGLPPAAMGCSGLAYVPSIRNGNLLIVDRADLGAHPFALVEHPEIPRAIYLHRHPDDAYTAVLTRCTHRGCQVEPAGERLACPCHGSEYSLTGTVLHGPAERPLTRYAVTADADHITIHLPSVP